MQQRNPISYEEDEAMSEGSISYLEGLFSDEAFLASLDIPDHISNEKAEVMSEGNISYREELLSDEAFLASLGIPDHIQSNEQENDERFRSWWNGYAERLEAVVQRLNALLIEVNRLHPYLTSMEDSPQYIELHQLLLGVTTLVNSLNEEHQKMAADIRAINPVPQESTMEQSELDRRIQRLSKSIDENESKLEIVQRLSTALVCTSPYDFYARNNYSADLMFPVKPEEQVQIKREEQDQNQDYGLGLNQIRKNG